MFHRYIQTLSILATLAIPPAVFSQNLYLQHNLVSDLPGVADHLDPNSSTLGDSGLIDEPVLGREQSLRCGNGLRQLR